MISKPPDAPLAHPEATVQPAILILSLALMGALLALVVWRAQPPVPKSADSPQEVFSAGRALVVLQDLLGDGASHPTGSPNHDLVKARLTQHLLDLGYSATVQETLACRSFSGAQATCAPVQNVLARLDGQQPGLAVMLVAHYDSVGAGEGAADDGSGVAALLEVARILKVHGPFRNPVIFLFSDAEENGMLGAKGFVDQHPLAKEVGVAVNLEARGTHGQSLMFETSANNAWLVEAYAGSVTQPSAGSLFYELYRLLPNDTDLTIFKQASLAGMNFAFLEGSENYHTSQDNLQNLDAGSFQHQGDNLLAVARRFAGQDLAHPPAGDEVFMDILGLGVLRWPAPWSAPLASLALVLLAASAIALGRMGSLSGRSLAWGFLAALLAIAAPVVSGLGLTRLVIAVSGAENPWNAYPLPMRLALWAQVLFLAGLSASLFARRAGAWGFAIGVWLAYAFAALALSLSLPGISIDFLAPALFAGLLFAGLVYTPLWRSAAARLAALILPAFAAGVVWLPLARLFEAAVGFGFSPPITLAISLAASAWLPVFVQPPTRTQVRGWIIAASGLAALGAVITTLFVPVFTPAAPQQVNLLYVASQGRATWAADADPQALGSELRSLFDLQAVKLFPWSNFEFAVTEAPIDLATPPEVQVLSDTPDGAGRIVTLQLHSPRQAGQIQLLIPIQHLAAVQAGAYVLPVRQEEASNGYYYFLCTGLQCDGLNLALRFSRTGLVKGIVRDYSFGLPAGGESFANARSPAAVPGQDGDMTIYWQSQDY